jgi:hypothetical protein
MSLIRVGVEVSRTDLYNELSMHPCRYFFILIMDYQAALCIQTCDSRGEDIHYHIIDGMVPDSDGNLVSTFEEEIHEAIMEQGGSIVSSGAEKLLAISPDIAEKIVMLPGLIDWILSTVPTKGQNIVIDPISWAAVE